MTRLFACLLTSAALVGTGAYATTWDTNDDGKVDAEEFVAGNTAALTFTRFDDNSDGAISPNEVGLTEPDEVFRNADENNDGYLTERELMTGTFDSYDLNQDSFLDAEEMELFETDESVRNNPFYNESGVKLR